MMISKLVSKDGHFTFFCMILIVSTYIPEMYLWSQVVVDVARMLSLSIAYIDYFGFEILEYLAVLVVRWCIQVNS